MIERPCRGDVIQNEKGQRYLVVNSQVEGKDCIDCMDGHFNRVSIGKQFLKYFYYTESIDMKWMENWLFVESVKTIGDWLKEAMAAGGFKSQAKLSEASGVSASAISRFSRGLQDPTLGQIEKISMATQYHVPREIVDLCKKEKEYD